MDLSVKNTTFCINDYDIVGFDLDHTICKYKIKPMSNLIYTNMVRYLSDVKSYPVEIFEDYGAASNFFQKGITFDQCNGNFLKLADNLLILKAYHGTRQMNEQQIKQTYGSHGIFEPGRTIMSNFFLPEITTANIHVSRDYFVIPIGYICACIIDKIDRERGGELTTKKYKFWPDIISGLVDMFKREAFQEETGGYFKMIRDSPMEYIEKTDESVLKWLKKLKNDKKIFLLTNSHADIAECLLENCIGTDWKDYFDLVISYARKPGFYTAHRPFLELKGYIEGDEVKAANLNRKCFFSQGNWEDMASYFAKQCEKSELRFLYFGDSVVDDVYGPSNYACCDTIAIVEEMASEGLTNMELQHNAKEELNSTIWGSFFNDFVENNQYFTLFGSLIVEHSVLAIPDLKSMALVPLDKKIPRFCGKGSLDGFFPAVPISLKKS